MNEERDIEPHLKQIEIKLNYRSPYLAVPCGQLFKIVHSATRSIFPSNISWNLMVNQINTAKSLGQRVFPGDRLWDWSNVNLTGAHQRKRGYSLFRH